MFNSDYDQPEKIITVVFNMLQTLAHKTATEKGFWENPPEIGTSIALMHSELSEALEVARKNVKEVSVKIPHVPHIAEELADCIIRMLDFAEYHKLNLGEAIFSKMRYNENRGYKHGKRF